MFNCIKEQLTTDLQKTNLNKVHFKIIDHYMHKI